MHLSLYPDNCFVVYSRHRCALYDERRTPERENSLEPYPIPVPFELNIFNSGQGHRTDARTECGAPRHTRGLGARSSRIEVSG